MLTNDASTEKSILKSQICTVCSKSEAKIVLFTICADCQTEYETYDNVELPVTLLEQCLEVLRNRFKLNIDDNEDDLRCSNCKLPCQEFTIGWCHDCNVIICDKCAPNYVHRHMEIDEQSSRFLEDIQNTGQNLLEFMHNEIKSMEQFQSRIKSARTQLSSLLIPSKIFIAMPLMHWSRNMLDKTWGWSSLTTAADAYASLLNQLKAVQLFIEEMKGNLGQASSIPNDGFEVPEDFHCLSTFHHPNFQCSSTQLMSCMQCLEMDFHNLMFLCKSCRQTLCGMCITSETHPQDHHWVELTDFESTLKQLITKTHQRTLRTAADVCEIMQHYQQELSQNFNIRSKLSMFKASVLELQLQFSTINIVNGVKKLQRLQQEFDDLLKSFAFLKSALVKFPDEKSVFSVEKSINARKILEKFTKNITSETSNIINLTDSLQFAERFPHLINYANQNGAYSSLLSQFAETASTTSNACCIAAIGYKAAFAFWFDFQLGEHNFAYLRSLEVIDSEISLQLQTWIRKHSIIISDMGNIEAIWTQLTDDIPTNSRISERGRYAWAIMIAPYHHRILLTEMTLMKKIVHVYMGNLCVYICLRSV